MTFSSSNDKTHLESGSDFLPRFDDDGLIPAIAVDAGDGEVLMMAFMNAEALRLTIETGIATYWSRSRGKLWKKGETSGNTQRVEELRVDCDQDCLVLKVRVAGHGATCHTGRKSCFYRKLDLGSAAPAHERKLSDAGDHPLFDPDKVYE